MVQGDSGVQVKAVRGAVGIAENSVESIRGGVERLMLRLLEVNELQEEELVSVQFSITRDLTALNPASAFRELGFYRVPLFCAQEPAIDGAMGQVVRVLLTLQADDSGDLQPVYIEGAERLRPDLTEQSEQQ